MRGRAAVLVAAMLVELVAASGAALAEGIVGSNGADRLVGTDGRDAISGAGGNDQIYGKGAVDRLFGDSGNDNVFGGKGGDALQSGLGQDDLFGQEGNDFVNAIDGQANDSVNCGRGADDVGGVDFLARGGDISENCEALYVPILFCPCPSAKRSADAVADLSGISSVKEAERAVQAGLLKKVER